MSKTTIEWTDHSINPIRARNLRTNKMGHHCEKVSDGCKNCYASRLQVRFGLAEFAGPSRREEVEMVFDETKLDEVLSRKKPTRYFWCDMSDLFGEWVEDGWIDKCFAVMALTPQHTHQVLTKRPERMRVYLSKPGVEERIDEVAYDIRDRVKHWEDFSVDYIRLGRGGFVCLPLDNVWLGTSIENQLTADQRIPSLVETPAAVRFLSCEPLLGPVDLTKHLATGLLHWVIVGGES